MNTKRCFFFTGNMLVFFFVVTFLKMFILENIVGKVMTNPESFISLTVVQNNGAAFNLFAGYTVLLILFALATIFFCMIYVLLYKLYISDSFLMLMSIFSAGILGNAYERFRYDCVTDYIKVNLFNFPVFNLYDVLITVGAISLAFVIIFKKHREIKEIQDAEEDELYNL